jgi:hypothetical protein
LRIFNGWLLIDERDVINLLLNYNSIEEVQKHYVEKMNRSFLHYEPNCALCKQGYPIRQRFIAQVIFEANNLRWEFGSDIRRQLQDLEPFIDRSGFVRLLVSRLGKGRKTFYRCVYTRDTSNNRFTTGKYGHMVHH